MRDTAAIALLENFPVTNARVFADNALGGRNILTQRCERFEIGLKKVDARKPILPEPAFFGGKCAVTERDFHLNQIHDFSKA